MFVYSLYFVGRRQFTHATFILGICRCSSIIQARNPKQCWGIFLEGKICVKESAPGHSVFDLDAVGSPVQDFAYGWKTERAFLRFLLLQWI